MLIQEKIFNKIIGGFGVHLLFFFFLKGYVGMLYLIKRTFIGNNIFIYHILQLYPIIYKLYLSRDLKKLKLLYEKNNCSNKQFVWTVFLIIKLKYFLKIKSIWEWNMVDMQGRGDKADNFAWEVKKKKKKILKEQKQTKGIKTSKYYENRRTPRIVELERT